MEIQEGSIISGTHRTEDLMPVFINEILRIDPGNQVATDIWTGYCELEEEQLEDYWTSEYAEWDLEALFDALNLLCRDIPGMYFGTHPGDGSDFGFWVEEEE